MTFFFGKFPFASKTRCSSLNRLMLCAVTDDLPDDLMSGNAMGRCYAAADAVNIFYFHVSFKPLWIMFWAIVNMLNQTRSKLSCREVEGKEGSNMIPNIAGVASPYLVRLAIRELSPRNTAVHQRK